MNSLQSIKLTQFNINQKATSASVGRSISTLNNDIAAAIEHQVYARGNIDSNVDAGMVALMGGQVDALMSQFSQVSDKLADLLAVKAGTITIAALEAKYNVDIAAYSAALA